MPKEEKAIRLRQILENHFSLDELKTLCHNLGVDYDNISGENTKVAKSRELTLYMERQGRFHDLELAIKVARPHIFNLEKKSVEKTNGQQRVSSPVVVDRPPGGTIKPSSKFYVERDSDKKLRKEILRPSNIIVIRGFNEMGKSSLLHRGLSHAKENGWQNIFIDFQGSSTLTTDDVDSFYFNLAASIGWRLESKSRMTSDTVATIWNKLTAPQPPFKFIEFMRDYILHEINKPLILAMDEVNLIFNISHLGNQFFSLLKLWNNEMVLYQDAWKDFIVILTLSTKPYLLAEDLSPLQFTFRRSEIVLRDFNKDEVHSLNDLYDKPLSQEELESAYELLGGHPYLTDIAIYHIRKGEFNNWRDLSKMATNYEYSPFRDHFGMRYFALEKTPHLKAAMKSIIASRTCNEEHFFRLQAAGLVKADEQTGKYLCRYKLYDAYFRQRL